MCVICTLEAILCAFGFPCVFSFWPPCPLNLAASQAHLCSAWFNLWNVPSLVLLSWWPMIHAVGWVVLAHCKLSFREIVLPGWFQCNIFFYRKKDVQSIGGEFPCVLETTVHPCLSLRCLFFVTVSMGSNCVVCLSSLCLGRSWTMNTCSMLKQKTHHQLPYSRKNETWWITAQISTASAAQLMQNNKHVNIKADLTRRMLKFSNIFKKMASRMPMARKPIRYMERKLLYEPLSKFIVWM